MTRDVRAAYDQAAKNAGIKAVIPVGESWLRAMQTGVADANPYDGIDAGKLNPGPTIRITPARTAITCRRW